MTLEMPTTLPGGITVTEENQTGTVMPDKKVLRIPIKNIRAFEDQPRKYFNPNTLRELAESIQEIGQLTPALVKQLNPPIGEHLFELVEGERRIRACLMINVAFLRCEVIEVNDTEDQFKKSVAANFGREDHPPLESAYVVQRLRKTCSIEQICRIMCKSPAWVSQRINLLKLHPQVLEYLNPELPEDKQLVFGIALKLVPAAPDYQIALAKEIVERRLSMKMATDLIRRTIYGTETRGLREPRKEFEVLMRFASRAVNEFTLFKEMSPQRLEQVVMARGLQERMKLHETLTRIASDAEVMKHKIHAMMLSRNGKNGS